jgi:hypothetical protein
MNWYNHNNDRYKISSSNIRLWLDDERNPKDLQIQKLFGSKGDEVWVKTAPEAINVLKSNNVVFIDFDNDLGPPEAGEGKDVAKYIEEQAFYGNIKPLQWRVHSMNNVGVSNITNAMKNAEKFWEQNKNELV